MTSFSYRGILLNWFSLLMYVIAGSLLLFTEPIYSQNDTVNLQEVEVIGLKPEISTDSPDPVQQMSVKKINSLPVTTVADAVRNFSGVVVKDFGGIGGLKTVMIRSLGANHTAVFIDGLPAYDAATGQMDLGRVSLHDIGNLQLSVGQPEFGLNTARIFASAGVLNIRSKYPELKIKRTKYKVGFRYGSFGTLNPSISVDKKISEKVVTTFRYNHFIADGHFPFEVQNGSNTTLHERQNSDVSTNDALIKTKIILRDSSTLSVRASWYRSERGLPGAVIYYNIHSAQRLFNNDVTAGLQYITKEGNKTGMMVTANYTDNRLTYRDPNFQNQSGGINNEYNQQEYYISDAFYHRFSKNIEASLSSDLVFNRLNTNAYMVQKPDRLTSLTAGAIHLKSRKSELQGSLLMTASWDQGKDMEIRKYFRLSPAVSFLTSISKDQSLKARVSLKNTYRMPSFNELYYSLIGNFNLKPETATLIDAGVLLNTAINAKTGINARVDGFYNKVRNKIVVVPTQNLFIWSTTNIGKVDVKGVELAGGFVRHINDKLSVDLSGNYTYQEAKDISDKTDDNYGDQIAYIPFETAGLLGTVYYYNLSAGLNLLYNGFRYSSAQNITANLLDSWTTVDMTLGWEKGIKNFDLKIKGEIVNLFDRQYEVVRGFPMTGRAFYINLYLTI